MIIYSKTKAEFKEDMLGGSLIPQLDDLLSQRLKRSGKSEMASWHSSLQYMYMVMNDEEIPADAGVAIEYVIPSTSNRIDFLITGYDEDDKAHAVIVELKQWSDAAVVTDQQEMVKTFVGGGLRNLPHPSYQAWSYAMLLRDFNEAVQSHGIGLHPCAYLHNYHVVDRTNTIFDPSFDDLLEKSPAFHQRGTLDLRSFIKRYVRKGDRKKILYVIDQGRIRPSKSLQDALAGMLKGNPEFIMIDDQKTVYEHTVNMAKKTAKDRKRRVYIVEGGPGTGKSVVAVNLLSALTSQGMVCHYITKNSAPRDVYKAMLKGSMRISSIDNLFKGSGGYTDDVGKTLDVAIVDEAHRLNEKSDLYGNRGENQIMEIIRTSACSVFFIDEDQRISLKDIGTIEEIKKHALALGATVEYGKLESQFRCNGSDGYIAWLDDVLEIRETANVFFDIDYDIQVVDSPHELHDWVRMKNLERNRARVIAGYCWEWPTATRYNRDHKDIQIPDHDYAVSWNLSGQVWAINPDSVEEAGCIHTSQGLEFDYIGVIIGDDMRYENGHIVTDVLKRANSDASMKGIKKMLRENPSEAKRISDRIIKNTYRTLMSRGMKGCRVFCTDPALATYLKSRLAHGDADWTEYSVQETESMLTVAEDSSAYSDQ